MAQDPGLDDGLPVDVNGVISLDQSAAAQAQFSGKTVTPLQDFPFFWNGVIISFYAGQSAVVTPDLMAALIAQNAPVTTP